MNKIYLKIPFMWISVNKAYAWYKVRHKSKDYKEFSNKIESYFLKHDTKYEIIWDKFLCVKYDFHFNLFNKNWNTKIKDVANYEKCLTDELCKHIKWFEDHKIKHITLSKWDNEKEYMEVEIIEI
jgi:Holliday junction resolvase RusA-like endonuclease